jgi:serpin B
VGLAQVGPPVKLSPDATDVVKGNNVFALDLYAQLSKDEGNVFFSPYSISTALAMTYAGAKGKTAEQMASTLHFSLPPDKLHTGFAEIIKHLNAGGDKRPYELTVANSLWGQKGFTFLPGFVHTTETKYGAAFKEVDFQKETEKARQAINAWVEEKTKDKIKELLQQGDVTEMTRLVLTNAIYFKASWAKKFHVESTKEEEFTLPGGGKVKVDFMRKQFESMPYFDGGKFHLVSIPYKDDALSMIVLLPKKDSTLAELEKSLTAANLSAWLGDMKTHDVDLKLPKFRTTSRFELKKVLSDMGMPVAFTPEADFSGITSQTKLMISKVIHKAFVDVHEKGTEAAAATAVIVAPPSAPPQYPKATFHADRPFVFLLHEHHTNSILFMGRLNDPTEKSK